MFAILMQHLFVKTYYIVSYVLCSVCNTTILLSHNAGHKICIIFRTFYSHKMERFGCFVTNIVPTTLGPNPDRSEIVALGFIMYKNEAVGKALL